MKKICIVGGMNFSIISRVSEELQEDSSICGDIQTRFGGVAFNLASVIAKHAGFHVEYMTLLSKDTIGRCAEEILKGHGISFDNSLYLDRWGSYYSDVCSKGFHYGINDMKIVDMINAGFINTRKQMIEENDILIVDENISSDVLEYIADKISIPIYCEATSPLKCDRIKKRIGKIHAIKFNKAEFCRFYETDDSVLGDDEQLLQTVNGACAKYTFVTLGENGCLCISVGKVYRYCSGNRINAVNTLQAGDAFFAGAITRMLLNEEIGNVLKYGSSCAEEILLRNNSDDLILSSNTMKKLEEIASGITTSNAEYNVCTSKNVACLRCSGSAGRYIYDKQ